MRKLLLRFLTVGLLVVMAVAAVFYWITYIGPRCHLLMGARIGYTESEVIKRLGKPSHVAKSRKEFTGIGNWEPVPTAPVEKEVLEYYDAPDWKMYVYINRQGKVQKVFLART